MLKLKKIKWLSVCAMIISMLIFAVSCGSPSAPDPVVVSVIVSPSEHTMGVGTSHTFTAEVDARYGASNEVTWSVSGNAAPGTFVEPTAGSSTTLTVAASETAATLTVTATSAHGGVTGSATVTISTGTPAVTNVTVTPNPAQVIRGQSRQFTAVVDVVFGASQNVTWSVANADAGVLHEETGIGRYTGLLTVHEDEQAAALVVTATSVFDPGQYGIATVTLTNPVVIDRLWLVGTMTNDWTLPGEEMTPSGNGIFTWEGDAEVGYQFRFRSAELLGWENNWVVPESSPTQDGVPVVLGSSGNSMRHHSGYANVISNYNWWIDNAGWYTFTVDTAAMTLIVERPVTVKTVTITNPPPSIRRGDSHTFTAILTGPNTELFEHTDIVWTVTGNNHLDTRFGTGVQSNELTVATEETAGSLTVTAIADNVPSGPENIAVVDVDPLPSATNVQLNEMGVASWVYGDETYVLEYELQLLRNGLPYGMSVTIPSGTFTHNFLAAMRGAEVGTYTFTVIAMSNDTNAFFHSESVESGPQAIIRRNPVEHLWWYASGIARWNNPDGYSDGYTIRLYKNGGTELVGSWPAPRGNISGSPPTTYSEFDFALAGAPADSRTVYSFTITALGIPDTLIIDSETIELPHPPQPYSVLGNSRVMVIVEGGTGNSRRFVAGAYNGRIAWSDDGFVWHLSAQNPFTAPVRGIAFGNGVFVAVGHNGMAAFSDTGGATWTEINIGGFTNTQAILTIAYGSGTFLVGGDGQTIRVASSSDLNNWASVNTADLGNRVQPIILILHDGTRFVAFTEDRGQHAFFNSNEQRMAWLGDNAGANYRILGGAFGSGTFVIGIEGNTHLPRSSTLGPSGNWQWSEHNVGSVSQAGILSVAFGGGSFFVAGNRHGDNGHVSISTNNGVNWTVLANPFREANAQITAALGVEGGVILAGPGRFAFVEVP